MYTLYTMPCFYSLECNLSNQFAWTVKSRQYSSVCYHQVCFNAAVLANDRPFIVLDSVLHGGKDDAHIDCLLLHVETDGKKEAGGDTSRTLSFVTCLTWLTLAPGITHVTILLRQIHQVNNVCYRYWLPGECRWFVLVSFGSHRFSVLLCSVLCSSLFSFLLCSPLFRC